MTVKTARELVLERHPTAFIEDDGERIRIRIRETETVKCGECRRLYTRKKGEGLCRIIGGAGNSEAAWEDAVKRLGLL